MFLPPSPRAEAGAAGVGSAGREEPAPGTRSLRGSCGPSELSALLCAGRFVGAFTGPNSVLRAAREADTRAVQTRRLAERWSVITQIIPQRVREPGLDPRLPSAASML